MEIGARMATQQEKKGPRIFNWVVWSNVDYPSCAACTCFTWEEFCFQSVFSNAGGWDPKKLSEAHFPHLALFLCVSVDRSCLSRGNLVLRSQLWADLISFSIFFELFSTISPGNSSRRGRWRRWRRRRQRRWSPSPRGGWTKLSSNLVFSRKENS